MDSRGSIQGELKSSRSQEKILHSILSSLAVVFDIELLSTKQEDLTGFVRQVKEVVEKKDGERLAAAEQMAILLETQTE